MTIEELAQNIQVLNDIEAIKQLQYRYINCLTFTQWDAIMECLTEDCTLDLGDGSRGRPLVKGKKEIEKHFKEHVATGHIGREGNLAVHPIISVQGDTATGKWITYFMHIRTRTGEPLQWMQGIYDCTYKKENGQWKFSILKWRSRLKYIESQSRFDQIQYET